MPFSRCRAPAPQTLSAVASTSVSEPVWNTAPNPSSSRRRAS